MDNKLFNMRRYLNLLRVEWTENWIGKPVLRFAAPFVGYMIIAWFMFWIQCSITHRGELWDLSMYMRGMTLVFFFGFAVLTASLMCSPLTKKSGKIRWFSTPGTMLEKYLVMLTSWVATVFVILPVMILASDLLRTAIFSLLYPSLDIPFFYSLSIVGGADPYIFNHWSDVGTVLLSMLCTSATYSFGATVWHKLSIVKTSLFLIVLSILSTWFAYSVIELTFPHGIEGFGRVMGTLQWTSPKVVELLETIDTYNIILAIGIVFYHVMAYFRLRETDLTNRL